LINVGYPTQKGVKEQNYPKFSQNSSNLRVFNPLFQVDTLNVSS